MKKIKALFDELKQIVKSTAEWMEIANLPKKFEELENRIKTLEKTKDPFQCPQCHQGRLSYIKMNSKKDRGYKCLNCNFEISQHFSTSSNKWLQSFIHKNLFV